MMMLKAILILVEIISSILLIVIILLQRSKSEGLGLAFGSQMGESLFGARAGNVLVKATVWLGVIFLVNTIVLAKIYSQGGSSRSLISESSVPMPVERQVPAGAGQFPPPPTPSPSPVVPFNVPDAAPAPAP